MKKLISAVLAAILLVMCGISVFAEDVIITNESNPPQGKTEVYTSVEAEDVTYTVTIPADTAIAWGSSSAVDMSYTVKMQPELGGEVKVSVKGSTLQSASGNKLPYAYTGFAAQTFKAETTAQINTALSPATRVTVTVSDWRGVPIAEYRATLTYTVAYEAA